MSLNGGWVSYGGDARIELAGGLLAAAGCVAYAGFRLRRPLRATRPPTSVVVLMFSLWALSLIAFVVGLAVYVKEFVHDYPHIHSGVTDPITPVTLLLAVALFAAIMTRRGWPLKTRLGSAAVGAMAAPMIFELPFDLIVMARTYPPLFPHPAFYRAVFFTPLIMVEFTTLWLLTLSPMVRVRRSTLICFALMIGVFGGLGPVRLRLPAVRAAHHDERDLEDPGLRHRPDPVRARPAQRLADGWARPRAGPEAGADPGTGQGGPGPGRGPQRADQERHHDRRGHASSLAGDHGRTSDQGHRAAQELR